MAIVAVVLCTATPPTSARQDPPAVGQDGKDVEWVPTPDELIETMLDLADVTPADVVVDLGSGDGRLVIAAAERGARALGVEYDAELVELSKERARTAGVSDRASFVEADLFEVDLSEATVITMFLLPDLNLRLRPRLLDLAPGTRLVSNTWDMGEWIADDTVQLDPCPGFCTALLWRMPARVGGTWTDTDGPLTFDQQFQRVSGQAVRNGRGVTISEGHLRGDRLQFQIGDAVYRGRVDGRTIRGTRTFEGQTVNWMAHR